jgi:hypothetical protein
MSLALDVECGSRRPPGRAAARPSSTRWRMASERESNFCITAQRSTSAVSLAGSRTADTGSRPVAGRTRHLCFWFIAFAIKMVPRANPSGVAQAARDQTRESSDTPRLKAFWRVAPSVRFSRRAIFLAGVLLRASDFNSRTSPTVHSRRARRFLAVTPSHAVWPAYHGSGLGNLLSFPPQANLKGRTPRLAREAIRRPALSLGPPMTVPACDVIGRGYSRDRSGGVLV